MTKILFVDHTPFAGGGQLVLGDHIAELDKGHFEPYVVCSDAVPSLIELYRTSGAKVFTLSLPRLRGAKASAVIALLRSAWQLRRILVSERIDIVVANTTRASYIVSLAVLGTGIPSVWWVRDFLYPKVLFKVLQVLPKKIFCVSHAVADFYMKPGHPKVAVLYVANNLYKELPNLSQSQIDAEKRKYGLTPDDVVLGFMGRLVAEKGPEDVVEAVLRLSKQYPRLKLLIVGTGRSQEHDVEEKLHNIVTQQSWASSAISFAGFQQNQALYYSMMDIFVLSTRDHEGFATSVVQAMMARTTVIGTNAGGTPELVVDGQTGLLYPPGDVGGLTGAIQKLLDDPLLASSLAQAGQARVLQYHTEEQLARQAEALYAQLTNAR